MLLNVSLRRPVRTRISWRFASRCIWEDPPFTSSGEPLGTLDGPDQDQGTRSRLGAAEVVRDLAHARIIGTLTAGLCSQRRISTNCDCRVAPAFPKYSPDDSLRCEN